jgi:hypothetical protein
MVLLPPLVHHEIHARKTAAVETGASCHEFYRLIHMEECQATVDRVGKEGCPLDDWRSVLVGVDRN